jgi:hypothetical protein
MRFAGPMRKSSLYLPNDLALSLAHQSRATGVPQATLVRQALTEYLDTVPPPPATRLEAIGARLRGGRLEPERFTCPACGRGVWHLVRGERCRRCARAVRATMAAKRGT